MSAQPTQAQSAQLVLPSVEDALAIYAALLDEFDVKRGLFFIAGGSASGKSYFAKRFVKLLEGRDEEGGEALHIDMDDYYKPVVDRQNIETYNFDRPKAVDLALLSRHLDELIRGKTVFKPVYAYNGIRKGYKLVEAKPFIVVEGLFASPLYARVPSMQKAANPSKLYSHFSPFYSPPHSLPPSAQPFTQLFMQAIFVEASPAVALRRRLRRDAVERGYDAAEVISRWYGSVVPAYKRWVERQKNVANTLVRNDYLEELNP